MPRGENAIPTLYRGVLYPSRVAAAKAAGVTPSALRICLAEGRSIDLLGEPKSQTTIVRGVTYPSQNAAAAALGVCPSAISNALRLRGTADRVGLGRGGGVRGNQNGFKPKPIEIGGLWFRSRGALAEYLEKPKGWVQSRLSPSRTTPQRREELLAAVMKRRLLEERSAS